MKGLALDTKPLRPGLQVARKTMQLAHTCKQILVSFLRDKFWAEDRDGCLIADAKSQWQIWQIWKIALRLGNLVAFGNFRL